MTGSVDKFQDQVLALLADKIDDFYLAGGTALSRYYFQHRHSEDLDFFTQSYARSRIKEIIDYLSRETGNKINLLAEESGKTGRVKMAIFYMLRGRTGLKLDFVSDNLKLLQPCRKIDGIFVLSLKDIYLRKIYAMIGSIGTVDAIGRKISAGRQTAKDFCDLYFLSHTYQGLADFAWKYCNSVECEALINWYRTYDRMNIKTGLLDLILPKKQKLDYKQIEEHFKKEIDRLLEKEIGKNMSRDWLWDRKITLPAAKQILRDPAHPRFVDLAALLLSRKNSPSEVFREYIRPVDFCRNWTLLKKEMNKDTWGSSRIHFWQAVYEKVREKLKKQGTLIETPSPQATDVLLITTGEKLSKLRAARGLTQQALARKLHISQQIISRIESGRQNISLITLKQIASALEAKVEVGFSS